MTQLTNNQIIEAVKAGASVLSVIVGIVGGLFGFFVWRRRKKYEANLKADTDKKIEAFKAEQNEKVQKVIESHKAELQKEANELSQTLSEKITRRSKVFDYLTKQEFEFYDGFNILQPKMVHAIDDVYKSFQLFILTNDNSLLHEAYKKLFALLSEFSALNLGYQSIINIDLAKMTFIAFGAVQSFNSLVKDILINNISIEDCVKDKMEKLFTIAWQSMLEVKLIIGIIIMNASNGNNPENEIQAILKKYQ